MAIINYLERFSFSYIEIQFANQQNLQKLKSTVLKLKDKILTGGGNQTGRTNVNNSPNALVIKY